MFEVGHAVGWFYSDDVVGSAFGGSLPPPAAPFTARHRAICDGCPGSLSSPPRNGSFVPTASPSLFFGAPRAALHGWVGLLVRHAHSCRDMSRWRDTLCWRSVQQLARGVTDADCRRPRCGWRCGVKAPFGGCLRSACSDLASDNGAWRECVGTFPLGERRSSARSTLLGPAAALFRMQRRDEVCGLRFDHRAAQRSDMLG